jgi:ATP-dependent RNA helicase DeaD
MSSFSDLGLSDHLLATLAKLGYETPTAIQAEAIPVLLGDPVDFIGLAQTGTGKTAAFGLPLLEKINISNPAIQAVVLAPTRELGQQTAAEIKKFSAGHKDINVECVYGGAAIMNQIKALRKPVQVLIATPGRLIDLAKRKALKLDQVKYLVLDEADEMLNMGFREELDDILKFTPDDKVTWLFSATMPSEIRRLTKKYMTDPMETSVSSEQRVNVNIEHQFAVVRMNDKTEALRRFIDNYPGLYALAFCRTKAGTQKVATDLASMGYRADAIHGDLSQGQRNLVMRRFKAQQLDVLVATDVAARGIDVNNLTHVFHYDLPSDGAAYTHRSGRTARAGRKGISICFVSRNELYKLDRMKKHLKLEITTAEIPTVDQVISNRIDFWAKDIVESAAQSKVADELVAQAEKAMGDISRTDLLRSMLAQELDKMNYGQSAKDLNQDAGNAGGGGNKRDRNREDRPERSNQSASRSPRFFINIGEIDGLNRGELVKLICKRTKLDRAVITQVEVTKQHSFFTADIKDKNVVTEAFKGMNLNGRGVRVNEEKAHGKAFRKKGGGKRPFRPAHDSHRGKRKGGGGGRPGGRAGGGGYKKRSQD